MRRSRACSYNDCRLVLHANNCRLNVYADSSPDPFDDPKFETFAEMHHRINGGKVGIVSKAYLAYVLRLHIHAFFMLTCRSVTPLRLP